MDSPRGLPFEVLEGILTQLEAGDLFSVAASNKFLYRTATNSRFWEPLFFQCWTVGDSRIGERRMVEERRRRRMGEDLIRRAGDASDGASQHGAQVANRTFPLKWSESFVEGSMISGDSETVPAIGTSHSHADSSWRQASNQTLKRRRRRGIQDSSRRPLNTAEEDRPTWAPELFPGASEEIVDSDPFDFYDLYVERVQIDRKAIASLRALIEASANFVALAEAIIEEFGDDIRDVLVAIACAQDRLQAGHDVKVHEHSYGIRYDSWGLPPAADAHRPEVVRSESHHMVIKYYARYIYEHLSRADSLNVIKTIVKADQDRISLVRNTFNSSLWLSNTAPADEALACLTPFRGSDRRQIREFLDTEAVACDLYLQSDQYAWQGGSPPSSPPASKDELLALVRGICYYMRLQGWVGAQGDRFHDLDNHFLNYCLFGPRGNRSTLPMSLVAIFVGLARRLGVEAGAAHSPLWRMIAVVNTSRFDRRKGGVDSHHGSAQTSCVWVDLYEADPIIGEQELRSRFHQLGVESPTVDRYIESEDLRTPAPASRILVRSSRNIFDSIQRIRIQPYASAPTRPARPSRPIPSSDSPAYQRFLQGLGSQQTAHINSLPIPGAESERASAWHQEEEQDATYAGLYPFFFTEPELNFQALRELIMCLAMQFTLDVIWLENHLADQALSGKIPSHATTRTFELRGEEIEVPGLSETISQLREQDQKEWKVRKRSELKDDPKLGLRIPRFQVGSLFKHRVYGYLGVILAWDQNCANGEDWIAQMGVDELPNGGRHQPFYKVFAADRSDRYVAECNIIPAAPPSSATASSGSTPSFVPTAEQIESISSLKRLGELCRSWDTEKAKFRLTALGCQSYPEDD